MQYSSGRVRVLHGYYSTCNPGSDDNQDSYRGYNTYNTTDYSTNAHTTTFRANSWH